MEAIRPDLAIGTTPVVQKGKETGHSGALLHQPDLGAAVDGAGRGGILAEVVNAAIADKGRMDDDAAFFEGVGAGDTAGVWEGTPNLRPDFRAQHQKKLDKAQGRKAEEMIICPQVAASARMRAA